MKKILLLILMVPFAITSCSQAFHIVYVNYEFGGRTYELNCAYAVDKSGNHLYEQTLQRYNKLLRYNSVELVYIEDSVFTNGDKVQVDSLEHISKQILKKVIEDNNIQNKICFMVR